MISDSDIVDVDSMLIFGTNQALLLPAILENCFGVSTFKACPQIFDKSVQYMQDLGKMHCHAYMRYYQLNNRRHVIGYFAMFWRLLKQWEMDHLP